MGERSRPRQRTGEPGVAERFLEVLPGQLTVFPMQGDQAQVVERVGDEVAVVEPARQLQALLEELLGLVEPAPDRHERPQGGKTSADTDGVPSRPGLPK